ncbi:hypothetical protein M413DRAFT_191051 [Hebeloma cylindrosporum]|uniref:Uncharacterized protein n=1 Tax=Hebeloma cylindrosporum TaxID=76867 RepID=A0A0C2XP44_HEBCY|nr:hypothetical protein M413DRAFT_191051 [Hebeloma cylindrosporum h7]
MTIAFDRMWVERECVQAIGGPCARVRRYGLLPRASFVTRIHPRSRFILLVLPLCDVSIHNDVPVSLSLRFTVFPSRVTECRHFALNTIGLKLPVRPSHYQLRHTFIVRHICFLRVPEPRFEMNALAIASTFWLGSVHVV